MMRLNKVGVVVLEASEEFEKYEARKLGLRDVFKMKRDYLAKQFEMSNCIFEWKGKEIKGMKMERKEVPPEYEMPSQEEIDEYIRAREEYIADAILKECGWEDFVKRCKAVNIEDYIAERVPCEGPKGQCNMFCPKYFDCTVI